MKRSILYYFTMLITFFSVATLPAEVKGRVDGGPVWMRVKMKANEKTVRRADMWGGRLDVLVLPFQGCSYVGGFCLKPFVFGGRGDDTSLLSWGCGFGHYTPVTDRITLVPLVGVSHTNLHSRIDIPIPELNSIFENQREKIESNTFYIGSDAIFKITNDLYFTAIYSYGFAKVQTRIGGFINTSGHSQGSNFGGILDYYFTNCLSANIAFAYNTTLDQEKNGIDGFGFKLGLAYLF